MGARAKAWLQRVDALSLRERATAVLLAIGVAWFAWDNLLMQPLDARRNTLEREVNALHKGINDLNRQVSTMVELHARDPDADNRERLGALRAELGEVERTMLEVTRHLVPPREMARLLEAVLTRETALELRHLEGLGAEPLLGDASADDGPGAGQRAAQGKRAAKASAAAGAASAQASAALFRHGLRIEFRGGYLETLRYLEALEQLSWRFLWDGVDYRVERYPDAKVAIVVYSLSLHDAWIGI